jgi:ribosomal protein S18 acetylase RimI-like enzyme
MTSGVSYEILDLRHFSAGMLRPLLEAEERVWRQRLHWDYRGSARLLMQYLDGHMLPGYAALDRSRESSDRSGTPDPARVAAYAFCVYEDTKAVVGDVFANPTMAETTLEPGAQSPTELEETLLRHLLETLEHSPHVDRIESQLLIHPSGSHEAVFRENGFQLFRRLFMVRTLEDLSPLRAELAAEFDVRPWRDEDLTAASRLICECYAGHPDSYINDQYRTQQGSLRFLHNIVRYSGCGTFSPAVSHLVFERATRQPVALLLGSRVSADSGHITQLCVRPQDRRRGLARFLLGIAAQGFMRQGMTEVSLTVTEANADAIEIYRREGYEMRHSFDAAVWERQGVGNRDQGL